MPLIFLAAGAGAQARRPETVGTEAGVQEKTFLEGGGVKVAEGLILHPRAEIATAYQTNVFYSDAAAIGAPFMRFTVGSSLATVSAPRLNAEPTGGSASPKLDLSANLELGWKQYFDDMQQVESQSDLEVGAVVDAKINPESTFVVNVKDAFIRAAQPPQGVSNETIGRDRNLFTLGGTFKPGGGAIQATLSYQFDWDNFENQNLAFADRMAHTIALGGRWQWLPMTRVTFDASLGFVAPSEETAVKTASMPLRVMAGISTLITPTFGAIVKAGYGNGFYDAGTNFNSYLLNVEGRFAVGPSTRAAVGYWHDFADSVIANYYEDHTIYGRLGMQFAHRLEARLIADLRFRTYEFASTGPLEGYTYSSSSRGDVVYTLSASADYQLNPWLVLGGAYAFKGAATEFVVTGPEGSDDPSYVWHEVLARVQARF